ncbi:hypothetical protein [Ornithinicoccus hortensis]|uniref:hypothetical protein n=1 Tax=Ornithinicoccus hortensis TaxID=82346 RepID=UPI00114FEB00|nr:hypothetical protein [Ornithinicoccus hortensis]
MSQGDYGQPYPGGPVAAPPRLATGRIVATVIAVLAAVPLALGAAMLLISTDADRDMHGYLRILGFFVMVPGLLVFVAALPLALPPRLRLPYVVLLGLLLVVLAFCYLLWVRR